MLYCLYVDEKGTVFWGKETLENLFEHPHNGADLMNSDASVFSTQIMLGEDCHVWELVRAAEYHCPNAVVKDGGNNLVDLVTLVPNSLHELRPEGIGTPLGVRRGEDGFESIETGAPVRTIRLP